jgi:hypothetical protein
MPLTQLAPPYPIFTDKNGLPLDAGYLYFGVANQNPETNPVQIYYDSAFTQPVAQPVRTSNGYVMRNGSPALIYAGSQFSVTVRDKSGQLVIYSPAGYGIEPNSIAGTVTRTNYTGDGVTDTFGMNAVPVGVNVTDVYVDGVYQNKNTYTVSGANLTFSVAPSAGEEIEILVSESAVIGQTSAQQVLYNQGGTGAVDTNVRVKLQEFLSTKDFGGTPGVTPVILNVPSAYSTIQDAFDYLSDKTIAQGTTVQIKVADGTYTLATGIDANHPQGGQIHLVGNTSNPDNCVITVAAAPVFDAIKVSNGNTLGFLDGFKLNLAGKATMSNNWTAILAVNGSVIICGQNIKTNNWYYGIAARDGSFVSCDYAEVDNAGDVGIWAFVGSTVYCRNAVSNNASDVPNNLGFGFQAEYGSSMDCSNASATGCNAAGIAALSNSTVRAWSCTASGNTGSGFYASAQGHIENHNATANSNGRYGEERNLNGTIVGGGITLSGNTLGQYNPYAYIDNTTLGARIAAVGGPLRIDTDGTDPVFFNTSGGTQFEVAHQANAVNHPFAKGGQTGNPAILGASGTDTLIDLYLVPKGVGSYVRIAAGYTAGALPIAGYIEIKDNAGTIRKLAVVA